AISPMRCGSTPKAWEPARASPESLSRTRWKAVGMRGALGRRLVAHLEAAGAAHLDIFAEFCHLAGNQLGNGHLVVFDEVLLEQAMVFKELPQLSLGDLFENRSRLAGVRRLRLLAQAGALGRKHVRGDAFAVEVAGAGGRHVHGQIVDELLKFVGAGDEVALAGDFDQHAELAAGVNIGADRAWRSGASGLLSGRRDAMAGIGIPVGWDAARAARPRYLAGAASSPSAASRPSPGSWPGPLRRSASAQMASSVMTSSGAAL